MISNDHKLSADGFSQLLIIVGYAAATPNTFPVNNHSWVLITPYLPYLSLIFPICTRERLPFLLLTPQVLFWHCQFFLATTSTTSTTTPSTKRTQPEHRSMLTTMLTLSSSEIAALSSVSLTSKIHHHLKRYTKMGATWCNCVHGGTPWLVFHFRTDNLFKSLVVLLLSSVKS